MSEIRANTVSNAAGTGPATLTGQYAAKTWVNFDGSSTAAIRQSGGISSLTDNSTGNYTISFTSTFANSGYCATVGLSQASGQGVVHQLGQTGPNLNSNNFANFGTGSLKIVTGNPASSVPYDPNSVNIATHGDLA